MSDVKKTIEQYNSLIQEAESLKLKLQTLKTTFPSDSFRPPKVLTFLISAMDHVSTNLLELKNRHITYLIGD